MYWFTSAFGNISALVIPGLRNNLSVFLMYINQTQSINEYTGKKIHKHACFLAVYKNFMEHDSLVVEHRPPNRKVLSLILTRGFRAVSLSKTSLTHNSNG